MNIDQFGRHFVKDREREIDAPYISANEALLGDDPRRYSFDITFTGNGRDKGFTGTLVDVMSNTTYEWKSVGVRADTAEHNSRDQDAPGMSIHHLLDILTSISREEIVDSQGNRRFEDLAQKEANNTFERAGIS